MSDDNQLPPGVVDIPLARWCKLMCDTTTELTAEEIAAGWHWCPEFDDLLIGPGMSEMEFCNCELPK